MIVAFTGHRPDKLGGFKPNPIQLRVRKALLVVLDELQPSSVISGMALGVDQWVAETAVGLTIPLIAAVPFQGQESRWPREAQEHYRHLLAYASTVKVVSEGGYDPGKMQIRNEWMVDNCDLLVAVWDRSPGGTANCVRYADKVGRPIRLLEW